MLAGQLGHAHETILFQGPGLENRAPTYNHWQLRITWLYLGRRVHPQLILFNIWYDPTHLYWPLTNGHRSPLSSSNQVRACSFMALLRWLWFFCGEFLSGQTGPTQLFTLIQVWACSPTGNLPAAWCLRELKYPCSFFWTGESINDDYLF